jgi:hypothetical protein
MQSHYNPMPVYLPIDPCVPFQLPSPPDSQYSSSPSPQDWSHHHPTTYSFDLPYPVLQPIQVPQLTYIPNSYPSTTFPISKSRPPNINYNLSQHPQQTLTVKSLNLTMAGQDLTAPAIISPTGVATSATPLDSGYQPGAVQLAISGSPRRSGRSSNRHHLQQRIPHPYARLFAKKDQVKRRKIWNHTLEKSIFTPYEL